MQPETKPVKMPHLILATRNIHKTREFSEILGADYSVSDLTSAETIPAVEETGATFAENAVLKALAVSPHLPGLIVSDDSGLEVDALRGEPGVRSARYAGEHATDRDNVAKLLVSLEAARSSGEDRRARFRCVIALAENGRVLRTFDGTVRGVITREIRGKHGFGYDPVFAPDGYKETFAELGESVKNRISHRAQAIAQLRAYLKST